MGSQVLRLVDDDELVRDTASADISQRFEFKFAGPDQFVDLPLDRFPAFFRVEKIIQIVVDRLHPDTQFFIFVAGEIADVFAEGNNRP